MGRVTRAESGGLAPAGDGSGQSRSRGRLLARTELRSLCPYAPPYGGHEDDRPIARSQASHKAQLNVVGRVTLIRAHTPALPRAHHRSRLPRRPRPRRRTPSATALGPAFDHARRWVVPPSYSDTRASAFCATARAGGVRRRRGSGAGCTGKASAEPSRGIVRTSRPACLPPGGRGVLVRCACHALQRRFAWPEVLCVRAAGCSRLSGDGFRSPMVVSEECSEGSGRLLAELELAGRLDHHRPGDGVLIERHGVAQ